LPRGEAGPASPPPWLVLHGDGDELQPLDRGLRLAEEANAGFVTMAGAGHCSGNRDPVRFNLLIREFADEILGWRPRRRTWIRAQARPRRVLFVPGSRAALERDVDIADALRLRRPGLLVEWLAGEPLAAELRKRGETVHEASVEMPQVAEATRDLFDGWWDSDEMHFLRFMILLDASADETIDLVVADGAWGIDHHLHDNPELKHWGYAWVTDAIGWAPGRRDDDRRRHLKADANVEMVAQIERYPRIRDHALFTGSLQDVPDVPFGPGLPSTRAWARSRFTFTGADRERSFNIAADCLAELL
jgi:hypothetical protein